AAAAAWRGPAYSAAWRWDMARVITVLEQHRDDMVGSGGGGEGIDVVGTARFDGLDEIVELRRIFLTTQIEPYGLCKVGRVAHCPPLVIGRQVLRFLAQIDLQFLPVGVDTSAGSQERQFGGH